MRQAMKQADPDGTGQRLGVQPAARQFSMDETNVFNCVTLVRNERPALSENFVASRLLSSPAYAAALF